MTRVLQIAGVLWLSAALALGADQKGGTPKAPPRNTAPGPKNEGAARNEGAVKGARGNPPLRLTSPGNLAARLYQATPEQRERVLEKLPQARQEQARKQLEWFDRLPKPQQQVVLQRAERLAS